MRDSRPSPAGSGPTFGFDDAQGGEDGGTPQAFWDQADRACWAVALAGAEHCRELWSSEGRKARTVERLKGFAVRRLRRLASVGRRGLWAALRHPAAVPRWCLPYWFMRRREGDVYANAFTRLPSKARSCVPAGFMRLWSEHVASSADGA